MLVLAGYYPQSMHDLTISAYIYIYITIVRSTQLQVAGLASVHSVGIALLPVAIAKRSPRVPVGRRCDYRLSSTHWSGSHRGAEVRPTALHVAALFR